MRYSEVFKAVDFRENLLVDNATTHTKTKVDVNYFSKEIDHSSTVEYLTWHDEKGEEQLLNCYFKRGDLDGISKGLSIIYKELEIIPPNILKTFVYFYFKNIAR